MPKSLGNRFTYFEDEIRPGGTADVYRGLDIENRGREVAIKLLKQTVLSNEHTELAFEREIRSLEKLSHPNIVELIDIGKDTDSGRRFLVMEWLPKTLAQHISENVPANWNEFAYSYAMPLLSALKYAYNKDVVHRDLKPANILVDSSGNPKLVDFGIARLLEQPQIGHTMESFKTPPYCPIDDVGSGEGGARDAWGFTAACVALFSQSNLEDYPTLFAKLEDLDVPSDGKAILYKALAEDPHERYESVLELAADIDAFQSRQTSRALNLPTIPIKFVGNSLELATKWYPQANLDDLKRRYLNELNESAFITKKEKTITIESDISQPPDLQILAGDVVFLASIDERGSNTLAMKGSRAIDGFHAEQFQSRAWRATVKFELLRGIDRTKDDSAIQHLFGELEDFDRRLVAEHSVREQQRFFDTWRNVLRLKEYLLSSEKKGIRYRHGFLEGRRFTVSTNSYVSEELVGTRRAIALPNKWQIVGEVDAVSTGELTLYLDEQPLEQLPEQGILEVDNIASKLAIQRQTSALDAIRYGRSVGKGIRDVLIHPENVTNTSEAKIEEYSFPDLDADKRAVVRKAMGDNELLLVQGPPGTGKTQLIVEVVYQLLRRDPSCRILLTSQTHIALDNALERLLDVAPDVRAVRVGQPQNDRASNVVQSLTLAQVAQKWLQVSNAQTQQFLEKWASDRGISTSEVALGRAIAAYAKSTHQHQAQSDAHKAMYQSITQLESSLAEVDSSSPGATVLQRQESLDRLKEDYADALQEGKRLKRQMEICRTDLEKLGAAAQDFLTLPVEDLDEWAELYAGDSKETKEFNRLLDLAEDWRLRFVRSNELYPAVLADAQVVAGTCIGFIGAKGITDVEFDYCIVDEASKATASEVCVPISRSRKVFLVGDHKQLPPFLEEGLHDDAQLSRYGLDRESVRETLFERLYHGLPADSRVLLSTQYRMLPAIGDLISVCFYDGELESDHREPTLNLSLAGFERPVTWFSTSGAKQRRQIDCNPGFKNIHEADHIRDLLVRLNFCIRDSADSISVAVLTGYVAQRAELERRIDSLHGELTSLHIECGTVDSFQGRQADLSIFSVTKSNPEGDVGFFKDLRRLNVALSRGKEALAIVGDFSFALSADSDNPLRQVAQYIQDNPDTCCIKPV